MSDGKWSGGRANRTWARPGSRHYCVSDPELSIRLYLALAGERFWCEACGRVHPLREHRDCR